MFVSTDQIDRELKALIASSASLGDAIRAMYRKGYRVLLLYESVMQIANLTATEAKKLILRETKESDR